MVADYSNGPGLEFSLAGVDVVISTISGASQLALIDAAFQVGVRRFAPAEFEGRPSLRPAQDALDRGRRGALERLNQYQPRGMQYCVFVCGIFYERFAPGGMIGSNIGRGSGISGEGDYVLNTRHMKAHIPHGADGRSATVCITSAQDVGRFVAASVGMPQWPSELRMCGERINLSDLVRVAEVMRGNVLVQLRPSPQCSLASRSTFRKGRSQSRKLGLFPRFGTSIPGHAGPATHHRTHC